MLATALTTIVIAFLLWRAGGRAAYLFGWRAYSSNYHWWFAWRPVLLRGPDELDRERAIHKGQRVMWGRWVMRMPTTPGFYHVLPNWVGSRYTMLERPAWHFWVRRRDHAPVGYDRQDGITIEQATAMEPR